MDFEQLKKEVTSTYFYIYLHYCFYNFIYIYITNQIYRKSSNVINIDIYINMVCYKKIEKISQISNFLNKK